MPIVFDATQRWVVLAPHPDDEVLGTGGLLQCAVGAKARATLVLLTDGENNPWPQRFIERRLFLDHDARLRWGRRRRAEAEASLAVLGIDPADSLVPLGWPDGEIDQRFAADPGALVSELADVLEATHPTHLVLPSADDIHPDHNTSAAIGVLAARRLSPAPKLIAFRVHGEDDAGASLTVPLSEAQVERKVLALEEHATQLALSRRRFTDRARKPENFHGDPFAGSGRGLRVTPEGNALRITLTVDELPNPRRSLLRVVYSDAAQLLHSHALGFGEHARMAKLDKAARTVEALLPATRVREVLVKIEPKRRGIWIFDKEGWTRCIM